MVLESEPQGQGLEISNTWEPLASQVVLLWLTNLALLPNRLNFFPRGPSRWKMKLNHQCFDSTLRRGENAWQYRLPAGALCVQHLWPVPSPQSTNSFLFIFTKACLLTIEGVGETGQTCQILGKDSSFERQRPSSCWCCHDAIFTALSTAWCFKGRGSASAMLLSHINLQHYQEFVLPCSKTDGRKGSRLSLVPLFISMLKVCAWQTQVWNSTMTRHANLSLSCAWCRNSTGVTKWGCWQSFTQLGGLWLVASGTWTGLWLAGAWPYCSISGQRLMIWDSGP